jgi:hypothetical protein
MNTHRNQKVLLVDVDESVLNLTGSIGSTVHSTDLQAASWQYQLGVWCVPYFQSYRFPGGLCEPGANP